MVTPAVMNRPAVDVVIPFAGDEHAAARLADALRELDFRPDDTVVVVDNSVAPVNYDGWGSPVRVIRRAAERSSYYARNEGALLGGNDWLLFLDADCEPACDLIDRYFDHRPTVGIGALAGDILALRIGRESVVARYCRIRRHLDSDVAFRAAPSPYGATANLLVRRTAWSEVGGFCEGIRSAGDVEFCWRLQDRGWALGRADGAVVRHRHRDSVRSLGAQWRRMGAGWAWLSRHRGDVDLRPKTCRRLLRITLNALRSLRGGDFEEVPFSALDVLCHFRSLAGYFAHNRSDRVSDSPTADPIHGTVLIAAWPPANLPGSVVGLAESRCAIEVERRAARPSLHPRSTARVSFAEDDAYFERLAALGWLISRLRMQSPRAFAEFGWRLTALAAPVRRLGKLVPGTPLWCADEPWSHAVLRVAGWARIDDLSVEACDPFEHQVVVATEPQ